MLAHEDYQFLTKNPTYDTFLASSIDKMVVDAWFLARLFLSVLGIEAFALGQSVYDLSTKSSNLMLQGPRKWTRDRVFCP